jgi:hypothetical protein
VLTIDDDADWCDRLRSQLLPNASLHHVPIDDATGSILPIKAIIEAYPIRSFDVIVVDGHLRAEAAAWAFEHLAENGALILDNSEGYGLFDVIRKRNCRKIDFFGFVPGVSLRQCTSLVFVEDCFLLSPEIPIPDIEKVA